MKKILIFIFSIIICIAIPTAAYAAQEEFEALQMGSTGNQVIIVQQALRSLGFLNFRATGKYSNITFEAVRRFQQANKLPDDGQIGASSFELLTIGDAKIAPKNSRFKLIYGPYLENPSAYGELTPWSEVSAQLTVGQPGYHKRPVQQQEFPHAADRRNKQRAGGDPVPGGYGYVYGYVRRRQHMGEAAGPGDG